MFQRNESLCLLAPFLNLLQIKTTCHGGTLELLDKPLTVQHRRLRCMMGMKVTERELRPFEEAPRTVNLYGLGLTETQQLMSYGL
jgi:hypothetical protein